MTSGLKKDMERVLLCFGINDWIKCFYLNTSEKKLNNLLILIHVTILSEIFGAINFFH